MCDTFVAVNDATADKSIIFGKNSDREANEAQALEIIPAGNHPPGSELKCTYISIPQVEKTHAVLLCRPFWMWGVEMGANEKGLVIGNEAVFTRMRVNKATGLTGMDLIRLALERSSTARNALETIVELLKAHGQGGVCGYKDRKMAYHNSFIIADPTEAWVLETAGDMWAALKVKSFYAISNKLTIGEEYDLGHPELVETARRRGWAKKGKTFNFADAYSDRFITFFAAAAKRRNRQLDLINNNGPFSVEKAFGILRDHNQKEGYRPDSHFLGDRLCAHAANSLTRNATQTTGSLVAHLSSEERTFWATGTSSPCLSVFKPLRFEYFPPDTGPAPGAFFDPYSMWWEHELLHRKTLLDFNKRSALFKKERENLENEFLTGVYNHLKADSNFFRSAFEKTREKTASWIADIAFMPIKRKNKLSYDRYWKKLNQEVRIPVAT